MEPRATTVMMTWTINWTEQCGASEPPLHLVNPVMYKNQIMTCGVRYYNCDDNVGDK